MQLKEIRIRGFKSIYDCTLTDLQPVNVFHGDNNVGKSNLLRAIELCFQIAGRIENEPSFVNYDGPMRVSPQMSYQKFQRQFGLGAEMFSWQRPRHIEIESIVAMSPESLAQDRYQISLQIVDTDGQVQISHKDFKYREPDKDLPPNPFRQHGFYRISSARRLIPEMMAPTNGMRPEEIPELDQAGANLKERLFWASVSSDPLERKAFQQVLRPMFSEPPLSLGNLQPVARPGQPYDLQVETPNRSIPIDQLGSGIQQLALLGGMIALSQSWIVAIEEPEINLSWPTQKKLQQILSNMVRNQAIAPTQLFLASHSPLFEFQENFFRVEMVDGETIVTAAPNDNRRQIFDSFIVPEGRGTMVRSGNAVVLPEHVLETLNVSPGDAVYFHREGNAFRLLSEEQLETWISPGDGGE